MDVLCLLTEFYVDFVVDLDKYANSRQMNTVWWNNMKKREKKTSRQNSIYTCWSLYQHTNRMQATATAAAVYNAFTLNIIEHIWSCFVFLLLCTISRHSRLRCRMTSFTQPLSRSSQSIQSHSKCMLINGGYHNLCVLVLIKSNT